MGRDASMGVISALANKLEGLEAEMQTVSVLVGELERIVQEGKLRMQEPGRANG